MANKLLTETLSEPLDGATTARIDINSSTGHLIIDRLTGGEQVLASGTLQYFESQGHPIETLSTDNGQATLSLRGTGSGRSWFPFPWRACGGAFEWQVHLNPDVPSDITAHSDGGNVKLNLAGMEVTHLMADTGGGNMEVALPDNAASLSVSARTGGGNVTVDLGEGSTGSSTVEAASGAGNVTVHLPKGLAARVHAKSGLGKVLVDTRFGKTGEKTYESPDYEQAANKVDITVSSGAGNVSVTTR